MNMRLLRRVQRAILKEPKRIRMENWVNAVSLDLVSESSDRPACGTVGCIYGWGKILSSVPRESRKNINQIAADLEKKILGPSWNYIEPMKDGPELFDITAEQAKGLFLGYVGSYERASWPEDLRDRISDLSPGTPEYAQVVSEAIDRFIEDPDEFTYPME